MHGLHSSGLLVVIFCCLGLGVFCYVRVQREHRTIVSQLQHQLLHASEDLDRATETNRHKTAPTNTPGDSSIFKPLKWQHGRWPQAITSKQQLVDSEDNTLRCKRYNWQLSTAAPRKLFFGSLIADEPREVIELHAAEAFGIYHTVAIVEADRTQSDTIRQPHFSPWILASKMFGNETGVAYKFVSNNDFEKVDISPYLTLIRENVQRQHILGLWRAAGMGPSDVGILSDMDEVFTRDFLRALQVCEVPQFELGSSCTAPKIIGISLIFEMSPLCRKTSRFWYYPQAIVGDCVHTIGDPEGHPELRPAQYTGKESDVNIGLEESKWPAALQESVGKPLFNGWDYRMRWTSGSPNHRPTEEGYMWTGYHFHNFYPDDQTIRNKYATYGHPRPVKARQNPTLHKISEDMDRALACVFNESEMLLFPTALPVPFKHRLPVYFDVQWAEHRHQSIQKLANHGRDERAPETILKDANFSKRESSFRASVGVHS